MTIDVQVRLLISWHDYLSSIVLWGVSLCYTMVYKLTKVYTNDTWHEYAQEHPPLRYQKKNTWHLLSVCSIIPFPCTLKHKTIMSSIPIYYAICHNINKASLKKLFMLMNDVIFTISRHDTLSPSSGPSQIVCMTLNTLNIVVLK